MVLKTLISNTEKEKRIRNCFKIEIFDSVLQKIGLRYEVFYIE